MLFKAFGGGFDPIDYIELVACKDGTDVRVFFETNKAGTPPSWWRVYINDELTNQKAEALSFKSGDVVKVVHGGGGGSFFPSYQDFFSEIRGALPRHSTASYSQFAYQCSSLKRVPETLLYNMRGILFSPSRLFEGCGIDSVPKDIFSPLGTRVASFNWTFSMCRSLVFLDEDIFANFEHIGSMTGTFNNTRLQNVTLRFNATTSGDKLGALTNISAGRLTVIVKKGSQFSQALKASGNGNITIIEE